VRGGNGAGRRAWREELRSDRGDVVVTTAVVLPLILGLTWIGLQAITWHFAAEAALTAARKGAQEGSEYQSSPAAGKQQAKQFAERLAGGNLRAVTVSSTGSTPQRVRIEVSGTAPSLLPGKDGWRITQSATAPVERWTKPGDNQ